MTLRYSQGRGGNLTKFLGASAEDTRFVGGSGGMPLRNLDP
jgi:hypothetical protein